MCDLYIRVVMRKKTKWDVGFVSWWPNDASEGRWQAGVSRFRKNLHLDLQQVVIHPRTDIRSELCPPEMQQETNCMLNNIIVLKSDL